LNEAELQHVWKGLLSDDSVVKHAYDVSLLCSVCVLDQIYVPLWYTRFHWMQWCFRHWV